MSYVQSCMQHMHWALNTEAPHFADSFTLSGRRHQNDWIVGMLVSDQSSHILGVQSLRSRGCQAGGYVQRSGSGDAYSQSSNLIHRQDGVKFLAGSEFCVHQHNNAFQLQKHFAKRGHSPVVPVCLKSAAFSTLVRPFCTFTGAESTEKILMTREFLQSIIHVLDCGFSMVPVLCDRVNIHYVLDAQHGFCEWNPLACRRDRKSCPENWIYHSPDCFHLLATSLGHLAIWLVQLIEARILRHHRPELVELVDPGMFFDEGQYPVHQILKHTD